MKTKLANRRVLLALGGCVIPVGSLFSQAGSEPVRPMVATVAASGQGSEAKEPQVAVGKSGQVYITFGMGDSVYASVSSDAGKTYAAPVRVGSAGRLALGMRRGPRVAVTGTGAVITAVCGKTGGGSDGDVLAWRSVNNGKTWSGPVTVSDVPGAAREGLHAIASAPDNTLACTWLDLREKGTQIWASFSRDNGATWSKNVRVYRSPDGTVCECCHPSLAFDAQNRLYVMWRNSLGGARDMFLSRTDDHGKTFTPAQKLGTGTWPLDACPMDGGAVTATKKGVVTVWRRENTVFVTDSASANGPEKSVGRGQQGWLAATDAGTYFVWLRGRPGSVMLLAPNASAPLLLAPNGNDPVVAAGTEPNAPVVAVWSSPQGIQSSVLNGKSN